MRPWLVSSSRQTARQGRQQRSYRADQRRAAREDRELAQLFARDKGGDPSQSMQVREPGRVQIRFGRDSRDGQAGEVREHGKIANTPTALKGLVSRLRGRERYCSSVGVCGFRPDLGVCETRCSVLRSNLHSRCWHTGAERRPPFPKRRCRPLRGWRSPSFSEKLCHAVAAREDQVHCAEIRSPTWTCGTRREGSMLDRPRSIHYVPIKQPVDHTKVRAA